MPRRGENISERDISKLLYSDGLSGYAMHPNPAQPAECGMNGDLQVLAGVGGGVDGSAGLGVLAGDEGTDVDDAFAFLA